MHQVLERMYLVSTSRIHASAGELKHTIHVLKDITDRREAERRYRELFDNIQEGLFFAVPADTLSRSMMRWSACSATTTAKNS